MSWCFAVPVLTACGARTELLPGAGSARDSGFPGASDAAEPRDASDDAAPPPALDGGPDCAPLEQRIGAALALRSRGGDAQGRIRVAAETSVERGVRVALEAAAADAIDDRTIERALGKARATEKRRPE